MEAQLYETGKFPFTPEWYEGREHAPHREQLPHWDRMDHAARLVRQAVDIYGAKSIVDLGAGDGGLLSSLGLFDPIPMWGYDLMEANVKYAQEVREVDVSLADFQTDEINWADLVLCTEVIEHLEFPHESVREMAYHSRFIVCSSPASETAEDHTPEHAWVWDQEGYAAMLRGAGFKHIIEHVTVGNGDMEFQIVLARKPG